MQFTYRYSITKSWSLALYAYNDNPNNTISFTYGTRHFEDFVTFQGKYNENVHKSYSVKDKCAKLCMV